MKVMRNGNILFILTMMFFGDIMSAMGRHISTKCQRKLFLLSGNECAMPDCSSRLHQASDEYIGTMAHIVAFSDLGPRANSQIPEDSRNSYENLILLCRNCHSAVDSNPEVYTKDYLMECKEKHENKCLLKMDGLMSDVGYSELEIAIRALGDTNYSSGDDDYTIITPQDKIAKNGLSHNTARLLTSGIAATPTMSRFLSDMAKVIDTDYPNRLIRNLKKIYLEARRDSQSNMDQIFYVILDRLTNLCGSSSLLSCIVIVSYFFQNCEIFEK